MDAVSAPVPARDLNRPAVPESAWESWLDFAALPRFNAPPWLQPQQRLVVVAPHPDDELLACGGLLALHAARGGACLVVGVTDGEASHAGVAGWNPARLAEQRRAERSAGLFRLCGGVNVPQVHGLGLGDGCVGGNVGKLAAALRQLLIPGDVVITTWRHDGHPDHEATGRAAAKACAETGCRLVEAPVWMWHWASPGDARVPWHRLHSLAVDDDLRKRKLAGLEAHHTQRTQRDDRTGPVLDATIVARAGRPAEHYFV